MCWRNDTQVNVFHVWLEREELAGPIMWFRTCISVCVCVCSSGAVLHIWLDYCLHSATTLLSRWFKLSLNWSLRLIRRLTATKKVKGWFVFHFSPTNKLVLISYGDETDPPAVWRLHLTPTRFIKPLQPTSESRPPPSAASCVQTERWNAVLARNCFQKLTEHKVQKSCESSGDSDN